VTHDDVSQASVIDEVSPPSLPTFDDDLAANQAVENRLIWKELGAVAVVGVIVAMRHLWLH